MSHRPSGARAILAAILAASCPSGAAPITWGDPVAVSTGAGNSSDVSTNGTLVEAYNAAITSYTGGNQTVNGVTFVATTNLLPNNSTSTIDFSVGTNGGDAAYDAILSTLDFGGGQATTIVIGDGDGNSSVNGPGLLEVGASYEIQVWFVDDRPDTSSRVMGYASSASDTLANLNNQYVIGTFTADASTQTLHLKTVFPTTGFANAHLTAYQIRRLGNQGPTPVLFTSEGPVSGPFTVSVSFNSPVTGLEEADFFVENGSVTPGTLVGSGADWSLEITPDSAGQVRVTLPAGSAIGPNSLPNTASNTLQVWFGAPPPNFLFIITDDQDTYSIGAYRRTEPAEPGPDGEPYVVDTPNIDRLADEGMLFHRARIMGSWTGAVCTATRTSLQTGRATWRAKLDSEGPGSAANTLPGIFNRGKRGGLPDLPYATYRTAYAGIRQRLEAALMQQRIDNADPYAFLGDRSLWRFETGTAGQTATTLTDSLPFANTATAHSGNGSALPTFSSTIPSDKDAVLGQTNTLSLDFRRDRLNYLQVANSPALSFGSNPFTIEAWVKLRSMPTGANAASTMPVVMKRALATSDANIDYMFLAAAELQPLAAVPVPVPFRVQQITLDHNSAATLTFESNENFLYDIQFSPDLTPGGWTTVRSFIAGTLGASATTVSQLPMPGGDRGFYRIICRTPAE